MVTTRERLEVIADSPPPFSPLRTFTPDSVLELGFQAVAARVVQRQGSSHSPHARALKGGDVERCSEVVVSVPEKPPQLFTRGPGQCL